MKKKDQIITLHKLHGRSMTLKEIASQVGCKYNYVSDVLKAYYDKLGIKKDFKTSEAQILSVSLFLRGLTTNEIATKAGCAYNTASIHISRYCKSNPEMPTPRELLRIDKSSAYWKEGNLNKSEIINLGIEGDKTIPEIAEELNISLRAVAYILSDEREKRGLIQWKIDKQERLKEKSLELKKEKTKYTKSLGTFGTKATQPDTPLFSKQTQKEILKLKKDGLLSFQIARQLHISRSDVLCCLQMMN